MNAEPGGIFMQIPDIHAVGKRACDPSSWRIPWRILPDWEWVLVEEGEGTIWTDTGRHPVFRSSMMIFPPGLRHRIETSMEKPMRFSFVHFDAEDCFDECPPGSVQTVRVLLSQHVPVLQVHAFDRFQKLAEQILQAQYRMGTARMVLLGALQLEWFVLVMEEMTKGAQGHASMRRLERLRRAINADLSAEWPLPAMAACTGVCPDTLARDVMDCTGERPTWFRDRIRLEEAKRMLEETDLPIQMVLEKCGWPDPFYGSRRFRQLAGMPPSAWRSRHG
jgi:AraC-like DNA-binding protein